MLKTILNLFKLENRVVLDAAAAGHIADHHDRQHEVPRATETYSDHSAGDSSREHIAQAAALLSSPQLRPEPAADVVLVSNSLPEYSAIVAAVRPEAHIIVYDAAKDSAADVINKIDQLSKDIGKPIDSVTVMSHGSEGSFQLGNETVNSENINKNSDTYAKLDQILSDKGKIYIFGCNVKDASGNGQVLLDSLASATGAKVFASDDATGSGGDWTLEASSRNASGQTAKPPIDAEKLVGYTGKLAPPSLDLDANDSSGAAGSDFKASFTEGQKSVKITDSDLSIKDAQNGIIKSATIMLTNPQPDRLSESLVADVGNFNIKQTYNSATGVLTLEGLDKLENYEQVLRTAHYNNSSEDPATHERTITFTVQDAGGNISNVGTTRLAVTAVNNPPVLTLPGGGLPYGDKAGIVVLNKNAFVSDVDSRDFDGGQLTVKFAAGADANDKLAIQNGGDGGKITVSGSDVAYQGQVIASFSGGTSSVPMTFKLNAHANPVTVQSLVRSLTYENTATTPSQANRKVEFVVTDGDGGTSAPATQEISLNSVNDAPVNTVPGIQTIREGEFLTFSKDKGTTIAVWDVDAATGTLQVNVNVTQGKLKVADDSGAVVTNNDSVSVSIVGTVDQINAALNGMTYQPSSQDWYGDDTLTITTDDQGNTGSGGVKRDVDTVGIKVLPLNDPPFNGVPTGQTTSVDTDLVFNNVNSNRMSVNDPDAGPNPIQMSLSVEHGTLNVRDVAGLTVTGNNTRNVTITGEIGKINEAMDGMKYKPAAGWSGTDSMKVVSNDKGNTGEGGAKTAESVVDIAVVPKTPFNTKFTEGDPPVKVADQIPVGGVASGLVKSAKIVLTDSPETDKSVESLVAATSSQFNIKQSYNAATGVLTLEGIEKVENYQQILRSITYNNTSGDPNPLSRVISFQVTSTDGTVRDIAATTLAVKAVNNAPVLTLPGVTVNYLGNDPMIVNKDAFVSDIDSPNFDTGVLTVSFVKGGTPTDQLSISSEGTGTGQVSVSGNQVSYGGTVIGTYSGGTDGKAMVFNLNANANEVNVQALVRRITYINTIRNPIMQEREIQFVLTDGDGGTSEPQIQKINVLDYNEPPINVVPGPQVMYENAATGLAFGPVNSNTISISDPDAVNENMQVLLSVQSGTLKLAAGSGITATGDGTGSVILIGSQTQINTALSGLLYRPVANWSGKDTLSINTNDQGHTGLGGPKTASSGVEITVKPINDPPINHVPDPQVVKTNSVLSFKDINSNMISVSDVDAGDNPISVNLEVGKGTLELTANASGVTITGNKTTGIQMTGSISAINSALNGLNYTPTPGYEGGDSLKITTDDKGFTGDGGPKTDVDTVSITVSPELARITYFVESRGEVNISPQDLKVDGIPMGVVKSATVILKNPIDKVNTEGLLTQSMPAEKLRAEIDPPKEANIKQSYDPATGVLTLVGLDTVETYQKILRSIFYDNISQNPTASPQRFIEFQVTGADGNTLQLSKTGVWVVPVDNPPFIKLGDKIIFREGDGIGVQGDAVITDEFYAKLNGIIDVDSPDFDGGFLKVELGGATSADDSLVIREDANIQITADNKLIYNNQVIGSFEAYTPQNGLVIHFNSNTKADPTTGKLDAVQAVMDNITYQNMNVDNPPHHGQLTIKYTLNDGDSVDSYAADGTAYLNVGKNQNSDEKPLEIIALDDPPVNLYNNSQAFPIEPFSVDKDQSLVFSDATGKRITIKDVDADGTKEVQVILSVDHSKLTLSENLQVVKIEGNGTERIVMYGTVANINAALNGLTYSPTAEYIGPATITISVDDQGWTGMIGNVDPPNPGTPGGLTDTDQIFISVMPPPIPHRNEGGNPIPWSVELGVVNPPAIHPDNGWATPVPFPGPVEPNGPYIAYGRGLYGNPCGTAPLYPCCTLEESLKIGCRFAPAINPEARACNVTWEWMESIGWNVPYGWHGDYIAEEYDLYKGLFLRETGDKGFNVGAGELAESFGAVQEALDALRIRTEEYDVYSALFLKGPNGETFNDFGPGELKKVFYNGREQLDKSSEWCPAGEPYKQQQQEG